jgi:hypothetical protein
MINYIIVEIIVVFADCLLPVVLFLKPFKFYWSITICEFFNIIMARTYFLKRNLFKKKKQFR